MHPSDLLTAVLPSQGKYCACAVASPSKQHLWFDTVEGVLDGAAGFTDRDEDAYFALASFDESRSRKAVNARFMRSVFTDLDCGPGKAYVNKREAFEALMRFLQISTLQELGDPWIVDSGGGLHVYWPFRRDLTIEEWLPVAEAFKRTAKRLGFTLDWTATADAARVLRVPGSYNFKYVPAAEVRIKHVGTTFDFDTFKDRLDPLPALMLPPQRALALPGAAPVKQATTHSVRLVDDTVSKFKTIMLRTAEGTGCRQLEHYVAHAQDDGMEPLWRGLLSIAHKCEDGWQAARKLSAMHPYDEDRLTRKWSEIKGPYPCTKFEAENPGVCTSCPHWGKITNPLALGRELVDHGPRAFTAAPVVEEADEPPRQYTVPAPPKGYAFGKNSVYRLEVVDGVQSQVPILLQLMFLADLLQEDDTYYARFCIPSADEQTVTFVVLPTKACASKEETIKTLASQNVFAAYGAGNDKHLFDYVRAAVQEASLAGSALFVPPKYGWQPTGGFAFYNVMCNPNEEYVFTSNKLSNLIAAMEPRGTLANWQRVVHMLRDKQLWSLLGLMCVSFGSPLMHWANNGASAMVLHAGSRESGVGKSLALELARGVWGNDRLSVVPKTSENTMLQRAGFLGGLPLLVDEVTNKNRNSEMEWIPNFIFDYSQGQHKLKGSGLANAELNNNMSWAGIALLTSNSPVLEHMVASRDTTSNGEVRRFLEWRSELPLEFGFEERQLLQMLNANRGVAGPAYARWLVRNQETAREVYNKTVINWAKEIEATDAERFWVSGCGAMLAGAILIGPKYANLCTLPVRGIMEFYRSLVLSARSVIKENIHSAEDLLNAFTRDNHGSFVKYVPQAGNALFANGNPIKGDSARGKVTGRVEYGVRAGWVDFYIDVATMKKYCSLRNWSYRDFTSALQRSGMVRETHKDLLANTDGPKLYVKCLHVARPSNGV